MALDANIILGVQPPKIMSGDERAANASKLQSLLLGNQEAQMKMQEYQRQRAEEDALKDYYRNNPNATGEQLRGQGYVKQGFDADKFKGEQAKNNSEIQAKAIETAHKKADLFGQAAGYVKNNPTPENAHGAIDQLASIGALSPEEAAQAHKSVPQDPAGISAWAAQHYVSALAAKDQLPKIDTQNLGGSHVTQSVDPVTGQVKVLNTMANSQSPDSIASNFRQAAEGAANRAVQMRGQNLADARAKETNQLGKAPNGYQWSADGSSLIPIPGGPADKAKNMNESQSNANIFYGRANESNKILNDLQGKYSVGKLGAKRGAEGIWGIGGALGAAGNTMLGPNEQQVEQAQRDFVNAVLRKESGASISPSEFENAYKQYFPTIGDSERVIKQKADNRQKELEGLLTATGKDSTKQNFMPKNESMPTNTGWSIKRVP